MVRLKKKVTIRTKHSEEPVQPPTHGSGGTWKKALLGVLGLLVVGGGCWYAFSGSKSTGDSTDDAVSMVQEEPEKVLIDSTASNVSTEEETASAANDAESANAPQTVKSDAGKSTESSEPVVNAISQEEPAVSLTGTLEQKANDVIRGIYGNGQERKEKLGNEYRTIQDKVNEMYRNGLVR